MDRQQLIDKGKEVVLDPFVKDLRGSAEAAAGDVIMIVCGCLFLRIVDFFVFLRKGSWLGMYQ